MAVTEIIKLETDANGAVTGIEQVTAEMQKLDETTSKTEQSTKSLKAQIREMTNELLNMAEDDPKRQQLIAQLGELKDRAADAADAVKGNTGPAFESMSNTFGIMTGQLANLDFDGFGKSLTQVGAAIGRIDFKTLKQELGGLVQGIGNLGKALLANPIFLVGAALAGIIVYWKELSAAVRNYNITQAEALENMEKSEAFLKESEGLKFQQAKIELLVRAVNDHSKSEADRKKALEEVNKALVANGQAAITDINATENIIWAKNKLIATLQAEAKVRGMVAYLEELYARQAKEQMEQGLATTLSTGKDAFFSIENLAAEALLGMAGTTKREIKNTQTEIDAVTELIYQSQAALDELMKAGAPPPPPPPAPSPKIDKTKEREEEIREEVTHLEKLESKKGEALLKGEEQRKLIITQTLTDRHVYEQYLEEENAKKLEAIKRQHLENYITITGNGLKALGDLVSAFNAKDEKRAKKQFQVMKSIQMASAIIDTYKAITGALADTATIPYYMKVANAAIAGVTGFAQVAKIAQTTYDSKTVSGGGGIGTGGSNGNNMPTAPAIDFGFLQQTGQPGTVETYVLAGNVANALEARQKIIDQSYL